MAVSSDPLSLIPNIGIDVSAWLSVQLLANDVATTGMAPQYAQFVLNLPLSHSRKEFRRYWRHIHGYCEELGVAITGGHTGWIEGQSSTISGGGTMFSTGPRERMLTSNNARAGDLILVTKEAAIVSTALLAMCFPETVKKALGAEVHEQACSNFYRSSVVEEALIASDVLRSNEQLRAMHDVTEGGVLGAIAEMASASSCGFRVDAARLPIGSAAQSVAAVFGIDPLLSVGAGSMIMAVRPGCESRLREALATAGIGSAVVGSFTEASRGCTVVDDGEESAFEFAGQDPYWEAFFKALDAGWR